MSLINKFIFSLIEKRLKKAYSSKYSIHGANPKSVFWKNEFTQDLRLELIINTLQNSYNLQHTSFLDIGCGYGRLLQKMSEHNLLRNSKYYGIDINEDFINFCKGQYILKNVNFYNKSVLPFNVDFTIMSGTYNLCTLNNLSIWEEYVCQSLSKNWGKTNVAMIFNLLVKNEKVIKDRLYYTNKSWIKRFCEQNLGFTSITKNKLLPNDIMIFVQR